MSPNTELLRTLSKEASQLSSVNKELKADGSGTRPHLSFALTLCEYPDIIITRSTPKTTKHLIIMPSAGAVFIKTEKAGKEPVSERLTAESFAAFTSGLQEDILLPEGFWTSRISKGKTEGEAILRLFADDTNLEMIRKKAYHEDMLEAERLPVYMEHKDPLYNAFVACPQLVLEYKDRPKAAELLILDHEFAADLVSRFGLENARDFFDSYIESLVDLPSSYGHGHESHQLRRRQNFERWETEGNGQSCIPGCRLSYRAFKDYVLYDAYRCGYGMRMAQFFSEWWDTLSMQYQLYGKIKDKYPDSLPTAHMQMSFKMAQYKAKIDEAAFAAQVEQAKKYEGEYKGYVFVAPKCRQDFIDEASAQCNCLAGYIQRFTDGNCLILFMRKKDSPEVSYITVEIIGGTVTQAKLARNYAISQSDRQILYSWVEKCNEKDAKTA